MYATPKRQTPQPTPDTADARKLCGCGLSLTFPHCDGSQLISRSRELGKLVSCGSDEPAPRSRNEAVALES
jgi:hypothetical protein